MTFLSAARTIPSADKIPIAVPACDIASNAYSTWYNRPSGENIVVCNARVNCNAQEKDSYRARADLPSNHTFSTFPLINDGLSLKRVKSSKKSVTVEPGLIFTVRQVSGFGSFQFRHAKHVQI